MKIRINIQAEQSNMVVDTRTYTVDPDSPHLIEETIDIPDGRVYTYTVTSMTAKETQQLESKTLNPRMTVDENGAGNE